MTSVTLLDAILLALLGLSAWGGYRRGRSSRSPGSAAW